MTPRQVKQPCTLPGCKAIRYAKELCRPHYDRLAKYGDPTGGPRPEGRPAKIPEAFAAHGLSSRQVEYLLECGHISAPMDANGRRQWDRLEVATGVLAYRLHRAGFMLPVAVRLARDYVHSKQETRTTTLSDGIHVRLCVPASRRVGK